MGNWPKKMPGAHLARCRSPTNTCRRGSTSLGWLSVNRRRFMESCHSSLLGGRFCTAPNSKLAFP